MKLFKEKRIKINHEVILTSKIPETQSFGKADPAVNLVRAIINNADAKIRVINTEIDMYEKELKKLKLELRATTALYETALPFYKEMEEFKQTNREFKTEQVS
jgi:hypothetical protein